MTEISVDIAIITHKQHDNRLFTGNIHRVKKFNTDKFIFAHAYRAHMNRLEIIQLLLKQKKRNNYLEIGVFNGHIFFGSGAHLNSRWTPISGLIKVVKWVKPS